MFGQQQLSPLSSRNRHFGDDAHPLHKVSWKLTLIAIRTKKVSKNGENAHHCHLLSLRLSSFVNLSINQNHGISWNHSHREESQKILKPFESYCYHLLPVYACWPTVLTSRCSSCLLHIHDCSVLQRKCGWTTWDWVEGPSLSWRSPVPAQGLQHRLPGLACWSIPLPINPQALEFTWSM